MHDVWNTTRNMNQRSNCVNACSTDPKILKHFELFIPLISAHMNIHSNSTNLTELIVGSINPHRRERGKSSTVNLEFVIISIMRGEYAKKKLFAAEEIIHFI